MTKFRKSVKIRQSYHEKFDAPFWGHSVYRPTIKMAETIFHQRDMNVDDQIVALVDDST